MRLIVGISGATGAIFGIRLLEFLRASVFRTLDQFGIHAEEAKRWAGLKEYRQHEEDL